MSDRQVFGAQGGNGNHPPEGVDPQGPTLEDFVNDERIRKLYADTEVASIFKEIEENPASIAHHKDNPKIQEVLRLIQSKFDTSSTPTH